MESMQELDAIRGILLGLCYFWQFVLACGIISSLHCGNFGDTGEREGCPTLAAGSRTTLWAAGWDKNWSCKNGGNKTGSCHDPVGSHVAGQI